MLTTEPIDYNLNWLFSFERGLSPRDKNLKSEEMQCVRQLMLGRERVFRHHLDVGTCTGRYAIELRNWVESIEKGGEIIGIDSSQHCIDFATGRSKERAAADPRIHFLRCDFREIKNFTLGKFDLITVMFGTLSHFGFDRNPRHEDTLQSVLIDMTDLLSEDGTLLLSNWSEYAVTTRDMIEIYQESERQKLAEWTPNSTELKERLSRLGLVVSEEIPVESRLRIFVCEHRSGQGSSRFQD